MSSLFRQSPDLPRELTILSVRYVPMHGFTVCTVETSDGLLHAHMQKVPIIDSGAVAQLFSCDSYPRELLAQLLDSPVIYYADYGDQSCNPPSISEPHRLSEGTSHPQILALCRMYWLPRHANLYGYNSPRPLSLAEAVEFNSQWVPIMPFWNPDWVRNWDSWPVPHYLPQQLDDDIEGDPNEYDYAQNYITFPIQNPPPSSFRPHSYRLQTSRLAGISHYDFGDIAGQIQLGHRLTLIAEPKNPHDRYAVKVYWMSRPIGYLPRTSNHVVSRLLLQGAPLTAEVAELIEESQGDDLSAPFLTGAKFHVFLPVS